ncbi:MAG: hypothetical protein KAT28_02325 [Candidatus Aenigmarchaeota archaeon]|nr:hypothetical protein [Candidatus Aenigmarchaeota archaeon]
MCAILKHFKKGFESYTRNFNTLILATLIIFTTLFSFVLLGFLAGTGDVEQSLKGNYYLLFSGNTEDTELVSEIFESMGLSGLGLLIIFSLLGLIITIFLQAGLWGVCLKSIAKKADMGVFFNTIRERGISYFMANLLIWLILIAVIIPIIIIATIIIIAVPGLAAPEYSILLMLIYLIPILLITPFFILILPGVVLGKRISKSIEQGFSLGKENYGGLLLLILIVYSFSLISLIPLIGTLLVYLLTPLWMLIIGSYYLEKTGRYGKVELNAKPANILEKRIVSPLIKPKASLKKIIKKTVKRKVAAKPKSVVKKIAMKKPVKRKITAKSKTTKTIKKPVKKKPIIKKLKGKRK